MLLPALAVNAIAMMAAALALWLADASPPQVAAHVAFGLGILPLILAAILHFIPVLTRSAAPPARLRAAPMAAWAGAAGIVAAFAGATGLAATAHFAALLAGGSAATIMLWIVRRARATLGSPHPGLRWYLAALVCLLLAMIAVPAMMLWPALRPELRLFHLHLNLLGFIGLTALGTLQVLLPTAVGAADPDAARRLAADLWIAFGGTLLIAAGAVFAKPLALAGAVLYAIPLLRMLHAWHRRFHSGLRKHPGTAGSLALAALGLAGLLIIGAAHAYGIVSARPAIAGFVCAFLLPLVSGAATQLLPVWLRPGPQNEWHAHLRSALGRMGGIRSLSMIVGGLVCAAGWQAGLWLAIAGAALLAIAFVAALTAALSEAKNLRN